MAATPRKLCEPNPVVPKLILWRSTMLYQSIMAKVPFVGASEEMVLLSKLPWTKVYVSLLTIPSVISSYSRFSEHISGVMALFHARPYVYVYVVYIHYI